MLEQHEILRIQISKEGGRTFQPLDVTIAGDPSVVAAVRLKGVGPLKCEYCEDGDLRKYYDSYERVLLPIWSEAKIQLHERKPRTFSTRMLKLSFEETHRLHSHLMFKMGFDEETGVLVELLEEPPPSPETARVVGAENEARKVEVASSL